MKRNRIILLATLTAGFLVTLTAAILSGPVSAQAPDAGASVPSTNSVTKAPADSAGASPNASDSAAKAQTTRHPGLDPFKANCASCHTIGAGPAVGPDLSGLMQRVPSRDWVAAFIRNPGEMIAKDEYAKALRAKYALDMSPFGHLSERVIEDLIDFIVAGGPGMDVRKSREATPEDVGMGVEYFLGTRALTNGGPACISCHDIDGVGGLGGGTLASSMGAANPNLTAAAVRNGGEPGLRAALTTPQFMVMNNLYATHPLTEDEVIAISAYLTEKAKQVEGTQSMGASLALWAVVGGALLILLMDIIWIRRFRNVRKSLVGGGQ